MYIDVDNVKEYKKIQYFSEAINRKPKKVVSEKLTSLSLPREVTKHIERSNSVSEHREDVKKLEGHIEQMKRMIQDESKLDQKVILHNEEDAIHLEEEIREEIGYRKQIEVLERSSNQVNQTKEFNVNILRNSRTEYAHDAVIEVKQGDVREEIRLRIDQDEALGDVLEEIKESINELPLDMKARVVITGTTERYKKLVIEGQKGEANAFSISDVKGSIVNLFELDHVTEEAKDFLIREDGVEKVVKEDVFKIDGRYDAKIQAIGKFEIRVISSPEVFSNQLEKIAETYNHMIQNMEKSEGNKEFARELHQFKTIVREYRSELKRLGVSQDENDFLSVNKRMVEKAMVNNSNKLKNIFQKQDGVVQKLGNALKLVDQKEAREYDQTEGMKEELKHYQNMPITLSLGDPEYLYNHNYFINRLG